MTPTPEQLHAHSIAIEAKILALTTILCSILKNTPEIKLDRKEIDQTIQSLHGKAEFIEEIRKRATDITQSILASCKR